MLRHSLVSGAWATLLPPLTPHPQPDASLRTPQPILMRAAVLLSVLKLGNLGPGSELLITMLCDEKGTWSLFVGNLEIPT